MNKPALMVAAYLLGSGLTAVAAEPKPKAARYPKELIGIWQGDGPTCELPGNLDSDARMDIRPDRLLDYEQWSEPMSVVQVSTKPRAWRIQSRLHIDGVVMDNYEIFSVSGEDSGLLTVIDENRSAKYVRCR